MTTQNVFEVDVVYCPMNEIEEYNKAYPKLNLVGVPNNIKGITPTRNFILDNETDSHIIMADDDVEYFFTFEKLFCQACPFFNYQNCRYQMISTPFFINPLAITPRCISEVPSKIRITRQSR